MSEEKDDKQENRHERLKVDPPHNNEIVVDKSINVKDDDRKGGVEGLKMHLFESKDAISKPKESDSPDIFKVGTSPPGPVDNNVGENMEDEYDTDLVGDEISAIDESQVEKSEEDGGEERNAEGDAAINLCEDCGGGRQENKRLKRWRGNAMNMV